LLGGAKGAALGGAAGATPGLWVDRGLEIGAAEMGKWSQAAGKLLLGVLGLINPGGPSTVPQDIRKVRDEDAPIEQPVDDKKRGDGESPPRR
jgi:hypothetical protein